MPNKIVDTYNHVFGLKGFDYDQINSDVIIGSNACCQVGFNRELLTKNVKADISLEDVRIDAPAGADYFLWLPTKNHEAPAPDKLALGVQTLNFFIKRKIKVYIHCKFGRGRAPTLFAAYLVHKGMGVAEAIQYLKSKRSSIHLTEHQVNALNLYKNSLKIEGVDHERR